jgi:hypothetical protein
MRVPHYILLVTAEQILVAVVFVDVSNEVITLEETREKKNCGNPWWGVYRKKMKGIWSPMWTLHISR